MGEMAGYGITAHLICQSFNDVFSKYGDRTPLFDNMHITATFATSEPTSIDKVVKRAGKALELRESYSDPALHPRELAPLDVAVRAAAVHPLGGGRARAATTASSSFSSITPSR